MVQLTDKIWSVELTALGDVFKNFRILPPDNVWTVPYLKYSYRSIYHTKRRGKEFYCSEEYPLEPGSWQFLFTTKEATWEDARKVVGDGDYADRVGGCYYKISESRMAIFKTDDPKIALTALLKAKGCDVSKNWAIIEKIK